MLGPDAGFKPYYNWNTFNTVGVESAIDGGNFGVLNLIITGIPSILYGLNRVTCNDLSFKPYYNWNTFNTKQLEKEWKKF